MTAAYVSFRHAVLPWTVSEEDERRFKRIVKRVLLICALIFVAMPWIPVKKEERTVQELPPQFAKLLLESKLDIRSVPDSSVLKVGYEAPTPELYDLLRGFYGCDPLARRQEARASGRGGAARRQRS